MQRYNVFFHKRSSYISNLKLVYVISPPKAERKKQQPCWLCIHILHQFRRLLENGGRAECSLVIDQCHNSNLKNPDSMKKQAVASGDQELGLGDCFGYAAGGPKER